MLPRARARLSRVRVDVRDAVVALQRRMRGERVHDRRRGDRHADRRALEQAEGERGARRGEVWEEREEDEPERTA